MLSINIARMEHLLERSQQLRVLTESQTVAGCHSFSLVRGQANKDEVPIQDGLV